METHQAQAKFFKILMHPTRLAILDMLRNSEQCVCHMEAALGLRQAHISQHLMVLREVGLVNDRRDGWNIFYRVAKPEIYQVIDAMSAFSDASSGSQTYAATETNQQACPCPKCNPGVQSDKTETPVLSLDGVKTQV